MGTKKSSTPERREHQVELKTLGELAVDQVELPVPDMTEPPVEEIAPEPAPAPVATITVNTKLMVKPTHPGITSMQEKHDAMLQKLGSAVRGAYPRNVLEFRACDVAGCVTYTLLELMQQFGPDAALGKALPFEEAGIVVVEAKGE